MISAAISAPVESPLLSVAMPLTAPSAEAALEFITWLMPSTVLSAGSSRLRRRGERLPEGRRSEQGFLVFSRADGDGRVRQVGLKSLASIGSYLADQNRSPLADHWAAVQSTQFRSARDGKVAGGYTADRTRHLVAVSVDLDGHRMDPLYSDLLARNWYAFREFVDELLTAVGVERYRLVRTGPAGVHIHIPLAAPGGRSYRVSPKTSLQWEQVSEGLHRYLRAFGADPNAAVKLIQPYALPGLARLKHAGYIPYVAGGRDGDPATLPALLRSLAARKMLVSRKAAPAPFTTPDSQQVDIAGVLEDIAIRAAGVASGCRNNTAFEVAVYLLSRGASEDQAWTAMCAWNRRNDPPLPLRDLRGCLASALRCRDRNPGRWALGVAAAWNRLRRTLGLPLAQTGYTQNGRWRPLTPPKSWEQRKLEGGREHFNEIEERLMRLVSGEGGELVMTQEAICDLISTNRSSLKAVLGRLGASGALLVSTKRGRGGLTTLAFPLSAQNGQSRLNTEGAKQGEWVGVPVFLPGSVLDPEKKRENEGGQGPDESISSDEDFPGGTQVSSVSSDAPATSARVVRPSVRARLDAVAIAVEIMRERFMFDLEGLDWLAVWEGRKRCVLSSRDPEDRLLLLFADFGYGEELGRLLGGVKVTVRVRRWRASFAAREWMMSSDDEDPNGDRDG